MKLYIDTVDADTARIAIEVEGARFEKTSQSRVLRAQMALPLIEELLQEHHVTIQDIDDIVVATGPGSYTGLRVGVSIANTLAFLLGVSVNGQKPPVVPVYE